MKFKILTHSGSEIHCDDDMQNIISQLKENVENNKADFISVNLQNSEIAFVDPNRIEAFSYKK